MEISKELASSVLGLNVAYTERCEHRDNIIGIWADMNTKPIKEINTYEFAFKCKEWALNKGYTIESHTNRSFISKYNREYFSVAKIFKETDSMRINTIDESTEVEAIIKACEWILEQSKCQN